MSGVLPCFEHDLVLAGVKAEPSGWPPASPDPGSGRGPMAPAGRRPAVPIHKSQASTDSGDCRFYSSGNRLADSAWWRGGGVGAGGVGGPPG